jgi:DHA1 family tetracycline resistance protein-like MFS transporter
VPTLFLVIFVNVLGFGLIIPLLPFFVERLGGGPETVTLIIAMYALIQFATSPWIGRLSDRFGRRPILIWTTAGTAAAHCVLAFADSLWLIILARALAGLMAGNLGVAFAYTADVTTKKNRAQSFGRLTTGFTLGFTFGPAIGGLLAGTDMETANFMVPALSAATLSVIACFCVIAFLPESLPAADRTAPTAGDSGTSFMTQLKMVLRVDLLAKLAVVSFLFFTAWTVLLSIFALWTDRVLERGPTEIGFLFMYMGLVGSVTQFTAIGPLTKKFGEMRVLHLTTVGLLLGFLGLTLTDSIVMVIVCLTVLSAANSLFTPVSTSMVSKNSPAKQRGAILGIFQSIGALGRVAGPAFSGVAFANLGYHSPFHISALVMVGCLILLLIASRQMRASKDRGAP